MGATQLLLEEAVFSGKGRTLLPITLQRLSRCEGIGRLIDAMPSLNPGVPVRVRMGGKVSFPAGKRRTLGAAYESAE